MTITHLSHFDVELISETSGNVVFAGTLAACRRMAFAHGLEVDRTEGATISSENGRGVYAPADSNAPTMTWLKPSGLIAKGRDDYTLVMPKDRWEAE